MGGERKVDVHFMGLVKYTDALEQMKELQKQ